MNIDKKNSEDYLKSVLKKETGFKTPDNYFLDIENRFSIFLSEEKLAKKPVFKIPDNYFENLESTILAKVSSKEKETKVISFKDRVLKICSIAAAATAVILFISLNSFVFDTNIELSLDNISDNEIEFWLEENTLTTNDIAAILEDVILDENEFYFTDINDKNIEEYIYYTDDTFLFDEIN